MPASWTTDAPRRTAAGIPDTLRFREKWRIALAHVRTVVRAGFTVAGVVVDADYGSNAAFRDGLERLGLRYAVAIRGGVTFWTSGARRTATAAVIAAAAHHDKFFVFVHHEGSSRRITEPNERSAPPSSGAQSCSKIAARMVRSPWLVC